MIVHRQVAWVLHCPWKDTIWHLHFSGRVKPLIVLPKPSHPVDISNSKTDIYQAERDVRVRDGEVCALSAQSCSQHCLC